jgi:hypothetical protein
MMYVCRQSVLAYVLGDKIEAALNCFQNYVKPLLDAYISQQTHNSLKLRVGKILDTRFPNPNYPEPRPEIPDRNFG